MRPSPCCPSTTRIRTDPAATARSCASTRRRSATSTPAYAAAEAAAALKKLFSGAHRALFDRTTDAVDGVDADLLIIFDVDDNVIWYNDEFVNGCELVAARAATGEPLPYIARTTLQYIEGLVEWAEEAHHDGYLANVDLYLTPSEERTSLPYDGYVIEMIVGDELEMPARVTGTPAHDGSARPQRRALSPNARMVAVLALQRLLDKAGGMLRVPLTAEEKDLLGEVIAALDPR
jgi:hypothetical protein